MMLIYYLKLKLYSIFTKYFFIFVMLLQMYEQKHVNAHKFRMDYMWAQAFKTFYRLHDVATTWDQARQLCEAEGTSLLVPDTLDEMENLKILISNLKAHYPAIFVGLHNKFSLGEFVTLKGEPITGTILELLWGQGSPNNANYSEHCVIMTREGLLDDRPCDDVYPFVCKIYEKDVKINEKCENFDIGYKLNSNGNCYKFHVEPLSWHDSYMICKAEGGNLVIINSLDKAALVTSSFSEHLQSNVPNPNILHIGFSDLMFPFQYRTLKGQSLEDAGYSSWSQMNENPEDMLSKRCGAISVTGFLEMTWCDRPAMFMCEKEVSKSPNNTSEE